MQPSNNLMWCGHSHVADDAAEFRMTTFVDGWMVETYGAVPEPEGSENGRLYHNLRAEATGDTDIDGVYVTLVYETDGDWSNPYGHPSFEYDESVGVIFYESYALASQGHLRVVSNLHRGRGVEHAIGFTTEELNESLRSRADANTQSLAQPLGGQP